MEFSLEQAHPDILPDPPTHYVKCERCEVCGVGHGTMVVDHNHSTGFIRGTLCNRCNVALTEAWDDPVWRAAALKYLGRGDTKILYDGTVPVVSHTTCGKCKMEFVHVTPDQRYCFECKP